MFRKFVEYLNYYLCYVINYFLEIDLYLEIDDDFINRFKDI